MKIVSWNVNGIRAVHRNGNWEPFIKALKPDLFGLQETKASPEQLPDELLTGQPYSPFFSSSQTKKGYSGVALYSKIEPVQVIYGLGLDEFDLEGRLIGAEYDDFWLINVYFPNGGRGPERLDFKLRYYDAFLSFVQQLRKSKPIIFCGHVNTAHEPIDLARPRENESNSGFLPQERAWIDELEHAGYVDIFRHMYPNKKDVYTYWDNFTHSRERNVGWRIDYFFVSQELVKNIKKAEIHSGIYGSDHCPISITL